MAVSSQAQPQSPSQLAPRRRYADNTYFEDGRLLTGILVSLLYLMLAISLDAAGYVDNLLLLLPVTLGALLLGMLMAFSRFDGFFALSHSMFAGLAWILFLIMRRVTEAEIEPIVSNGIPDFQARAYFVLLQWFDWLDAASNFVVLSAANLLGPESATQIVAPANNNYVFIFEIAFLLWWLTYLGVWAIFRHGYVWRAVIPAAAVLLINTYYAPNPIFSFLVVFGLAALMLLIRTHLAEQQLRWREQRIHFSQDISLDFLRNGLMYSVVVLALAIAAPGLGRNPQVREVLEPLNEQIEQTQQRVNELYPALNRQRRAAGSSFGPELTLGGARNLGNRPVFQVNAPGGRYWRAAIYDAFDGRTFGISDRNEVDFDADQPLPIPDWQLRVPLTQTVTMASAAGGTLFGVQDIFISDIPLESPVLPAPGTNALGEGPDGVEGAVELALTKARRPLDVGDSYTIVSRQSAPTQRALRSAGTEYPAGLLERYTQMPEDFPQSVTDFGRQIVEESGATTVYDQAKVVEQWLRTNIAYNEGIEAPPPNVNGIEYFLFELQEGYCDYYAMTMATMLRTQGIPARMAAGYAEGTYDEESGILTMTERDAHSWVEVFFPSYGWIEFEPTAGESELTRPEGEDPAAQDDAALEQDFAQPDTGVPEEAFEENDPLFDEGNLPQDEQFFGGGGGLLPAGRGWWLWALLTPLVALAGLFALLRMRVFGLGPTNFSPNLPILLYERLTNWAERIGLPLPAHHTPYERAQDLGQAMPEGQPFVQAITQSYVHHRFAGNGAALEPAAGSPEAEALGGAWRKLQPIMLRTWARRLVRRLR